MTRGLFTIILLSLFITNTVCAQVNENLYQLSAEYGLSYHAIVGEDTKNNSSGSFTSKLSPYWKGTWTHKIFDNFAYRFSFKTQYVEFNDIEGSVSVKNEKVLINGFEFAVLWNSGPHQQWGLFVRKQGHILYKASDVDEFELINRPFIEPGVSLGWGNRRRIGLLAYAGAQAFYMLPTQTEGIATGQGFGAGGVARLGWMTEMGVAVTIKGFYDYSTSPNAAVNFSHEEFGYSLVTTYAF